jgi:uncharacterized protein
MIGLLGAFALLYAVALAALYVGQRKLLYFPNAVEVAPASVGLPNAERLHLTTGDGERLLAWYIAPAAGKPLILYFHGNGGRARSARRAFQRLRGGGRWAAGGGISRLCGIDGRAERGRAARRWRGDLD